MSSEITQVGKGLASSDAATTWIPLWTPLVYEPDPITARTYAGGAIASWGGALYFGTMQVPGTGALVASAPSCTNTNYCYGQPTNQLQYADLFINTYRAISIWRIDNPTGSPITNLLYGEDSLPKYNGNQQFVNTSTGWTPIFGLSGFGNPYNNYTWQAAVYNNRLYFGTMDWRYLLDTDVANSIFQMPGIPKLPIISAPFPLGVNNYLKGYGADLWRFDMPNHPAMPENTRGLGNYLNYGIRALLTSSDGKTLFAGTANPMNLEAKGGGS